MDNLNIPSIKKLHNERNNLDKIENNIYNIVLNKCITNINYTNRYIKKTYMYFEVPKILIGQLHYNINSCILYIMKKFMNDQYIVYFIEPNILYIDWSNLPKKDKLTETTKKIMSKYPNATIEFV